MSIFSSIAADEGNQVKSEWEKELRLAYEERDWEKVRIVLERIENYYFSE